MIIRGRRGRKWRWHSPENICLRTNKTAKWESARWDEWKGWSRKHLLSSYLEPAFSSRPLVSPPSVEQMIWLENNGFPLTTPLSMLVPAHHAVCQLTKPPPSRLSSLFSPRRVDALWCLVGSNGRLCISVAAVKSFENSTGVSTAAFLKVRRP